MENEEFIREFLEESEENLDQLDQDFVALEKEPRNQKRVDNIYRTIHTIKGTSGFFGFSKLGAIAHAGENLLSHLRDEVLYLDEEITSALLASVDAIREVLSSIGEKGDEGDGDYRELNAKLIALLHKKQESQSFEQEAEPTPAEPTPDTIVSEANSDSSADLKPDVIQGSNSEDASEFLKTDATSGTSSESIESADTSRSSSPARQDPKPTTLADDQAASAARDSGPSADKRNPTPHEGAESAQESESDRSSTAAVASEGSIRVDVGLLNQLMDLVGELVLSRNQLIQSSITVEDRRFSNVAHQINRITTELQERVMKTRMQPIGNIWGKFPRVVRDLGVTCGKEVELTMEGRETEVDKSLLEAVKDPLTHLIRNAIDHGIESPSIRKAAGKSPQGHLSLRAWHQSGQVNIEITDNGRGIDPVAIRRKAIDSGKLTVAQASELNDQQAIELIFEPAFSTAEKVTDVSGRGVGMDVVRTNIESIGGTIDIQSQVGVGTAIKVKIPLTLAIVPALMVSSRGERFAIPQTHLVEMLRLDSSFSKTGFEQVRDTPVYRLRGKLLPLIYLNQVFDIESDANLPDKENEPSSSLNVVVLQANETSFGLVVDRVEHTEEIVVKPLHRALSVIPQLAGATVMGDGKVALILDVLGLAESAGLNLDHHQPELLNEFDEQERIQEQTSLLICSLRSGRRLAIPLTDVERLEDLPRKAIEEADGESVIQYRNQIMPVIDIAASLEKKSWHDREIPSKELMPEAPGLKIVVIQADGRFAGLAVDQILDVVQNPNPIQSTDEVNRCLLGSAVLDGRVTDIVNVGQLLKIRGLPAGFLEDSGR